MTSKRRWLWVLLFIWLAALLATLATGWNWVLVRDYREILELARSVAGPSALQERQAPWLTLILGTLGFVAALGTMVLFFVKLLKEMKLNQQQSEFLAAVTHELKTPIAALELSSTLLREGGVSEADRERLWQSHSEELQRLRGDVEALLEAARWQARAARIETRPLDFEPWVARSMDRWKRILGPDAELVRGGAPLPDRALLDEASLNLICDNLIDNARKFARGAPRVRVETRREGRRWLIEFRDDGWGFDPSFSKKIFHRFFRARHDAPYSIPGTGLGLFLANSASRAMGVSLSGMSEGRGRGACFTLSGRIPEGYPRA